MAWIAKNNYLGMTDMKKNAGLIYDMRSSRWSVEAIAGMLGNMQTESTINPGIWESLKPYWRGYGLTQWSPYTKLTDWIMGNRGIDLEQSLTMYNDQIERIDYEAENGLQWFSNQNAPIKKPPITLLEFLVSKEPPSLLANYFLWFYEHPAVTIQPNRAKQAEFWYEYLTGTKPPPGPHFSAKKLNIIYCGRIF